MNPFAIPPLTTSILVFLLGWFVFLKSRKEKPNLIFFLEALSISSWLYFDYLMYSGVLPTARFIWVKAAYFVGLLAITFWLFYSHSKDKTRPPQERNKIKLVLLAFIVGYLGSTDFL